MEITLLTMDVTATSPGTTSATTSQPGDNASTFAQLLSTQPQNTPSDKKNASISGHSSKENKAHNHTEKNKDQQNDDDINTIVNEYAPLEVPATKNTHLALSLPDNEQFSSILENKTASSLMSAEELAAELPVQLAGLTGLKPTSLSVNHAHQPHLLGSSSKHVGNGNELSHLMAENARAERDLVDKWQQFNTQANADDKSLLAQLRPETASLTQLATHEARHLTNGHSAKKVDNASLLSSVAEKADGLLADDKASANTKLTENMANQMLGNNRITESDLHNRLSTSSVFASSSVASHAQPSSIRTLRVLPGPTGERNTYQLVPCGNVLCISDNEQDALTQIAAVLASGCHAIVVNSPFSQKTYRELPDIVRKAITLTESWNDESLKINAVIYHGDGDQLRETCQKIAQRKGAIISVQGFSRGETGILLERLLHERALSINTAAAGGNASLMTIS
ncbi:hypothetical protein PT008_11305 [Proteus mirabilis]|nr:hypothetical protein [Proteus mirabilis]WFC27148.1 hypothetical protein PT008_11305 [Proteus mirabilis]